MVKPVECRIVYMPDGLFAVIAVLTSGKVFQRVGLGPWPRSRRAWPSFAT